MHLHLGLLEVFSSAGKDWKMTSIDKAVEQPECNTQRKGSRGSKKHPKYVWTPAVAQLPTSNSYSSQMHKKYSAAPAPTCKTHPKERILFAGLGAKSLHFGTCVSETSCTLDPFSYLVVFVSQQVLDSWLSSRTNAILGTNFKVSLYLGIMYEIWTKHIICKGGGRILEVLGSWLDTTGFT